MQLRFSSLVNKRGRFILLMALVLLPLFFLNCALIP